MTTHTFTLDQVRNLCRANAYAVQTTMPNAHGLEIIAHNDPVAGTGSFIMMMRDHVLLSGNYDYAEGAVEVEHNLTDAATPERLKKLYNIALAIGNCVHELETSFDPFARKAPANPVEAIDSMPSYGEDEERLNLSGNVEAQASPSMSLETRPGDKIIFTGIGGYPAENEMANQALEVGKEYTLASMSVGGWSTSVFIEGHKGSFNSVMFENAPKHEFEPAMTL